MAEPPPPRAPWLRPPLTYRNRGRGKVWIPNCSRPDSKGPISFPPRFPTAEAGYYRPYGNFRVGPYGYGCHPYVHQYQCVRPTLLPQHQVGLNGLVQNGGVMDVVQPAQAQENQSGFVSHGTGVFHPAQVLPSASCSNIKEKSPKQEGGANSQKKKKKMASKEKNDGSVKVKQEECYDNSLPPGINLPMEWTY